MILFDKFEDALEEAEWCAKTYRAIYYIVLWKGPVQGKQRSAGFSSPERGSK
jgi:hypothetical protein